MDIEEAHLVLELAFPAEAQAVRAAYLRLLRHTKPDSNPQAFRRLREAFELVRDWTENPSTADALPTPARAVSGPSADANAEPLENHGSTGDQGESPLEVTRAEQQLLDDLERLGTDPRHGLRRINRLDEFLSQYRLHHQANIRLALELMNAGLTELAVDHVGEVLLRAERETRTPEDVDAAALALSLWCLLVERIPESATRYQLEHPPRGVSAGSALLAARHLNRRHREPAKAAQVLIRVLTSERCVRDEAEALNIAALAYDIAEGGFAEPAHRLGQVLLDVWQSDAPERAALAVWVREKWRLRPSVGMGFSSPGPRQVAQAPSMEPGTSRGARPPSAVLPILRACREHALAGRRDRASLLISSSLGSLDARVGWPPPDGAAEVIDLWEFLVDNVLEDCPEWLLCPAPPGASARHQLKVARHLRTQRRSAATAAAFLTNSIRSSSAEAWRAWRPEVLSFALELALEDMIEAGRSVLAALTVNSSEANDPVLRLAREWLALASVEQARVFAWALSPHPRAEHIEAVLLVLERESVGLPAAVASLKTRAPEIWNCIGPDLVQVLSLRGTQLPGAGTPASWSAQRAPPDAPPGLNPFGPLLAFVIALGLFALIVAFSWLAHHLTPSSP